MKLREGKNEFGSPISVHKCSDCGEEFTVCPPAADNWGGCLSQECESYDPGRDVDGLFGDDSGKIVNLDDQRPHLTISADCIGIKECHVIPVALVNKWISGEIPTSNIPNSVLRTILYDWLRSLPVPDTDT